VDYQKLHIIIVSNEVHELQFINMRESIGQPCGKLKMANCTITEWVPLYNDAMSQEELERGDDLDHDGIVGCVPLVNTDLNEATDPYESPERKSYSKIVLRMYMMRRPNTWFYNVMLPTFMITTLSLSEFSMTIEDVEARCGAGLTALLTIVAMKFTVASRLPDLPYLTMLDQYLLYCMIYAFLCVIYAALLPALCRHHTDCMNSIESVMSAVFITFWIYINARLLYMINLRRRQLATGVWQQSKWGAKNQANWFVFTKWVREPREQVVDCHAGQSYAH